MTNANDIDVPRAKLQAELQECKAALRARDAFIGAISRELNNPLAPVLLAVERLRAVLPAGDSARLDSAITLVENATAAFERRTRVLLDLTDMAARLPSLTLVSLDLSSLAAAAAERHADMARRAGCALSVSIVPGVIVQAEPEALHRVLNHLLTNAFRFGSGHPVGLELALSDSARAVITVHDQGPGLSEDDAGRIFGLFQHVRSPQAPGLGLGLWIASQLVSAMGGIIGVKSDPGQGAHFHVSLPACQPTHVALSP